MKETIDTLLNQINYVSKNVFNISPDEDRRNNCTQRRAMLFLKANAYGDDRCSAFEDNFLKLCLFGSNLVSHVCSSIIIKSLSNKSANIIIINLFGSAEITNQMRMRTD